MEINEIVPRGEYSPNTVTLVFIMGQGVATIEDYLDRRSDLMGKK